MFAASTPCCSRGGPSFFSPPALRPWLRWEGPVYCRDGGSHTLSPCIWPELSTSVNCLFSSSVEFPPYPIKKMCSQVELKSLLIKVKEKSGKVGLNKAECQRIDAFELWCQRRLLRIPWTARRSSQSILKEISPEYSLEGRMLKLKHQ